MGYRSKKTGFFCNSNPISTQIFFDILDTRSKYENSVINIISNIGFYCLYCSSSRIACGDICCDIGMGFEKIDFYAPQYRSLLSQCASDTDCMDPTKPVCNSYAGSCVECLFYLDCPSGKYYANIKDLNCFGNTSPHCRLCMISTEKHGITAMVIHFIRQKIDVPLSGNLFSPEELIEDFEGIR